jgi:hypothetical protein
MDVCGVCVCVCVFYSKGHKSKPGRLF